MKSIREIMEAVKAEKIHGAWENGKKVYALELLEELEERSLYEGREPESPEECRKWMLNGAYNWSQYSWGGCSLIYNSDIARRLCSPSELKKTRNGERKPNRREEWLDVQARALFQAANMICRLGRY